MSNPSPLNMPSRTVVKPIEFTAPQGRCKSPLPTQPPMPPLAVVVAEDHKAKVVRPGPRTVLVDAPDDGVRKAKVLHKGQRVRPYLHGEPRGGVRVVESVERLEDGAIIRIAFSSGHPTTDYKAAYRFLDVDAVGKTIKVRVAAEPSFVPAH